MPKKQENDNNKTPTSIRLTALVVFSVIILFKLFVSKEEIPEWVLFVLIVIVAGGSSLERFLDKILERILGGK